MTTPIILPCPNGHLRRIIFGIGPYIADYPEQVLVSSVVSGWCPRYVYLVMLPMHQALLNLLQMYGEFKAP
jgi:hypothetical protein